MSETDLVGDYLRYLRDMSRKIAFRRSGFDNVIAKPGRSSSLNLYYYGKEIKTPQRRDWFGDVSKKLIKEDSKGLYIGIGNLFGRFSSGKTSVTISAPVIIVPVGVSILAAEEGGGVDIDPDWDCAEVNYDLISKLLGEEVGGDEDEFRISGFSQSIREAIVRIEDLVSKSYRPRDKICAEEFAKKIKAILSAVIPLIDSTSECKHFDIRSARDFSNQEGLTWVNDSLYFMGPKSSEVSAYHSISKLIEQLGEGNSKKSKESRNENLNRLIRSTVLGESYDSKLKIEDVRKIEEMLRYIPVQLSQRQYRAVVNAWTRDISYIQGPPGTGKSHTITAMILLAVMLDKRVLLVSNKKAALDVVADKLKPYLGSESLFFAVEDAEKRKEERARIAKLESDSDGLSAAALVERLKKEFLSKKQGVDFRISKIKDLESKIDVYLRQSKGAHDANLKFIEARDSYAERYGEKILGPVFQKNRSISSDFVRKIEECVECIEKAKISGVPLSRIDFLKIKAVKKDLVCNYGAEFLRSDLFIGRRAHVFLDALLKNNEFADRCMRIPVDVDLLRVELAQEKLKLDNDLKALLKQKLRIANLVGAIKSPMGLARLRQVMFYRKSSKLEEIFGSGSFSPITEAFPIWAGEIKDLWSTLPFERNIFDLVIVDEASQVNIAEAIPAFHRGARFCVVGDENQLGLSAAGFSFLNSDFEKMSWDRFVTSNTPSLQYEVAMERSLLASKCSILDFILKGSDYTHMPRELLDEHFRSKPLLAKYTSGEFYSALGGLKIMTESGRDVGLRCFDLIRTGGVREVNKVVLDEIQATLNIIKGIATRELLMKEPLSLHNFSDIPSCGVVCFTREQCEAIKLSIAEGVIGDLPELVHLFVGTPEEFQGNERDIVILNFSLTSDISRYAKSHYEDAKRLNVATSRARHFTYAVIGGIPSLASGLKRYFRTFVDFPDECEFDGKINKSKVYAFEKFSRGKCESEFENRVADALVDYVAKRANISLHNQVNACGQKRLDFVLYNNEKRISLAIEVDGPAHYSANGDYTVAHKERIAVLRRAGWQIVHVPYHEWYDSGWICDKVRYEKLVSRLYSQIDKGLSVDELI